jgi:hypothetical protein
MIIDLHVHSKYSRDNGSQPELIIEEALRKKMDAILVTEHHSYEASEPWEAWIRDKHKNHGLLIMRAVEVSTTSGHVIAIGFKDDSWNSNYFQAGDYLGIGEILAKIREIKGVSIIAHPYREMMEYPLLDRFVRLTGYTAVEGINGANKPLENERVIRIMNIRNKSFTGGSDAHKPNRVGSAYTKFYERIHNIHDLMIQLKSGRYTAHHWNEKNQ